MAPGERATGPPVTCQACDGERAAALRPLLADAAAALDLAADVSGVVLCVDDLPEADAGWLRIDPAGGAGRRPRLTVYCGWRALASETPGLPSGGEPAYAWEPALRAGGTGPEAVRSVAAAAFLHHQLLLARDLLRRELVPGTIPVGLAATFAVAWDVAIDGRLARSLLPGYGLEARRSLFSRTFCSASVLMPHHWQIFQSLWEGGLARQAEVLGAVRQLPRL